MHRRCKIVLEAGTEKSASGQWIDRVRHWCLIRKKSAPDTVWSGAHEDAIRTSGFLIHGFPSFYAAFYIVNLGKSACGKTLGNGLAGMATLAYKGDGGVLG